MCSWLPRGERVFFFIENGNGVLVFTKNRFESRSKQKMELTPCDAFFHRHFWMQRTIHTITRSVMGL